MFIYISIQYTIKYLICSALLLQCPSPPAIVLSHTAM